MRIPDWLSFGLLGTLALTFVEVARGHWRWALGWWLATVALSFVVRYWSVKYPAPMPYLLRWGLLVPRGGHSPKHLHRILQPQSGERLLEIGPGIGINTLPIASSLAPNGTLDILDLQQEMLDHVMRRASAAGITQITPRLGDAQELPYPDAAFDGAYLVGVLGEIPDGRAALRELRRVLKPTGRLIVGEVLFDPDFVFFGSLKKRAEDASFAFEDRLGGPLTYLSRFRPLE